MSMSGEMTMMTMTPLSRPRRVRCALALTAVLAVPALVGGCAAEEPADTAPVGTDGDGTGHTGPAAGEQASSAPVVDPACPRALTARQLRPSVDYVPADVDGDGEADQISIGSVTGAQADCSAALVVTTAAGTAVATLPELDIVPPASFVPGAAARIGVQTVVAAPVSFSPRGGGEVGLFTLVDGALVPVETESGTPWTILSTIDDGGGIPQSIGCAGDLLVHTTATSDPLAGEVEVRQSRWRIDGATATRTSASSRTVTPRQAPAGSGLGIFEGC